MSIETDRGRYVVRLGEWRDHVRRTRCNGARRVTPGRSKFQCIGNGAPIHELCIAIPTLVRLVEGGHEPARVGTTEVICRCRETFGLAHRVELRISGRRDDLETPERLVIRQRVDDVAFVADVGRQ